MRCHASLARPGGKLEASGRHTVDTIMVVRCCSCLKAVSLIISYAFLARSKVRLQTSCGKGCKNPTP